MKNRTHFSSRIGVRAVVAAMITSTALMVLLSSFLGAMGLWNYHLSDLPTKSMGFWVALSICWSLSMFVCGYMASSGARSQSLTDGIFNALTACSGIYLLFGAFFLFYAKDVFNELINSTGAAFYWQAFVGDFLGFAFGIVGAMTGTKIEQQEPEYFRKKIMVG